MTDRLPRVLLTHWVHPEVVALLGEHCEVVGNPGRETWPAERVRELAADCDAAMMFMPDRVDEAFLAACPRLRVIACALKGADNFDAAACERRGVRISVVPDLLTAPTADLAIALTLGLMRHVLAGDDFVRSGAFAGWRPVLYGTGLAGATVGLIGLGAVGRAVARRLQPFEAQVIYADPRVPGSTSLGTVLASSDVVMPLTHLTDETHHLIDAEALRSMKAGAFIVNVGRGSLVDEKAVADALESGRLAGYAADVFEMEDWALEARPREIDARLLADRSRTLFTPHLGSAVDSVRKAIAFAAAREILEGLGLGQ